MKYIGKLLEFVNVSGNTNNIKIMKIKLFILLLAPIFCLSQSDTVISYSGVIKVDSASKDVLFSRARLWVNDNFKSGKDVTQISDKEEGTITGSGNFDSPFTVYSGFGNGKELGIYTFSFKILCKDGRYKYIFENFKHTGSRIHSEAQALGLITSTPTCPVKFPMIRQSKMDLTWASAKAGVDIKIKELIFNLQTSMAKKNDSENF
jgi:hypothetical protein